VVNLWEKINERIIFVGMPENSPVKWSYLTRRMWKNLEWMLSDHIRYLSWVLVETVMQIHFQQSAEISWPALWLASIEILGYLVNLFITKCESSSSMCNADRKLQYNTCQNNSGLGKIISLCGGQAEPFIALIGSNGGSLTRLRTKLVSIARFMGVLLTFRRLTSTIVDVPHR